MDTSDVMLPLIHFEVANESCYDAQDDSEEASSGYESSYSTDATSFSSVDSISCVGSGKCRMDSEGNYFKLKSTRMLCENLKLILDMPEMCDVTFLVGQDEVPIHAVRAILGTRSRFFYQLILEQLHKNKMMADKKKPLMSNRLYIPVKKYDSEVFRMLVMYVHCGIVTITAATVTGLLCGAMQFQLDELKDACWEYIRRCLVSGRAETLLAPTRLYKHFRITEVVLNKIYTEMDKHFLNKKLRESTV